MILGDGYEPGARGAETGEASRLRDILTRWIDRGWLRPLDLAFGEFLWREAPNASPWLILAATLASHQLGRGHVCLDLEITLADPAFALSLPPDNGQPEDPVDDPPAPPEAVLAGLGLPDWLAALAHPDLVAQGPGATPLVLAGSRLYLRRYWQYEQAVRAAIEQRLLQTAERQASLPMAVLRSHLESLFPTAGARPGTIDWQKVACALAARSAFSIITGGPGTGKTTTVLRVLALLQSLALASGARALRIRLAAPTGKAAARLNQSLANSVNRLDLAGLGDADAIRDAIPLKVTTLHRLLGSRPDTRHFRHHAGNPLALDILVIDEASMIDLEMMAAVLAALPAKARLILLGDKEQLASVEAGAVLGELCQRAVGGHYLPATREWLHTVTGDMPPDDLGDPNGAPLDQSVVMLRHSHRFTADSGIGQLAEAVNAGSAPAVAKVWRQGFADLSRVSITTEDGDEAFAALVIAGGEGGQPDRAANARARYGYRHYLEHLTEHRPVRAAGVDSFAAWALGVLRAHAQFQLLCALRRGPWGVEGLNQRIARVLCEAGLIARTEGWYEGRPVLVTRNDYGLGLMNGDIGIALALPGPNGGESLRVAFPASDGGGIHWVLPSRLQAVETVYALTVHKSQGSEFTHAALVLPSQPNPILTRELLYTGITRASHWFTLADAGSAGVLNLAVSRRVIRHSGLLGGSDLED